MIAFHDNSSALEGAEVTAFRATSATGCAPFGTVVETRHPILTAETHNFPTGIAPFPGAETGTGGRIRDVQATGRGAFVVAGVSAYCMGALRIPGYTLPWEEDDSLRQIAANLAPPLQIQIEASNGASDYGNKFGEPVGSRMMAPAHGAPPARVLPPVRGGERGWGVWGGAVDAARVACRRHVRACYRPASAMPPPPCARGVWHAGDCRLQPFVRAPHSERGAARVAQANHVLCRSGHDARLPRQEG